MLHKQEEQGLTLKGKLLNSLDIQQSTVQRSTLEKSNLYFVIEG